MNPRVFIVFPALMAALGLAASAEADVSIGDYTGSQVTLLAIDDHALPLRDHLSLYLSKPAVRRQPVLTPSEHNPSATDGVATAFYGTVLHDGGEFRMWYYGLGWKQTLPPNAPGPEWTRNLREGPVCYAESDDGVHWTKPDLGQVEWNGSRHNNALALPSASTEGVFVVKDETDPDPARRYKMVYESTPEHPPRVETAVSADGIHWIPAGLAAMTAEPSSFYHFNGLYVINGQDIAGYSEGGHQEGRQGFAWVSTDFRHWLPQSAPAFLLPEPVNPSDRGEDRPYTQVHLGVGAAPFDNVLVGLYCRWHARPHGDDWFGDGTTWGDLGLVVSDDGLHFREPAKGQVFLSRADSPISRAMERPDVRYAEILTQSGNGILNVGNRTLIYHGRWMNAEHDKDYYIEIALATIPRDRWGALGLYPQCPAGSVWSAPLVLGPGARIALNAQGTAGISVEVADASFHLLPEFSGANRGRAARADGLDVPVTFSSGALDSLQGRPVRLLIDLRKYPEANPRLFALYVTSVP